MEIEEAALIDLYLKSIPKYGLQNILNIDNMIVLGSTQKDVSELKTAATNLNNVKAYVKREDLPLWEGALKEQVRVAVDRAKKLKNNS